MSNNFEMKIDGDGYPVKVDTNSSIEKITIKNIEHPKNDNQNLEDWAGILLALTITSAVIMGNKNIKRIFIRWWLWWWRWLWRIWSLQYKWLGRGQRSTL